MTHNRPKCKLRLASHTYKLVTYVIPNVECVIKLSFQTNYDKGVFINYFAALKTAADWNNPGRKRRDVSSQ